MAKVGFRKECFVVYLEMKRPWDFFFVFCVFQFFRDTKTCLDVYFSYDTKIEAWVREATISYQEIRRPRFGFCNERANLGWACKQQLQFVYILNSIAGCVHAHHKIKNAAAHLWVRRRLGGISNVFINKPHKAGPCFLCFGIDSSKT